MSNVKNVILKKKTEEGLYDLLVKTDANQVVFNDSTVQAKLTKAISDIVDLNTNKANNADVISAIVASATNAAISVTKGGNTTDVKLNGVVTAPTYDAETRTLTLPVTKSDGTTENVVMALGKDLVVKSGALDAKKENIELTLSNDEIIKIPVKSLVDIYTGVASSTVNVTVNANNEVSAEVRVSAKEGNQLRVVEEAGKEGLFVPQQNYDDTEIKTALNGKVDKVPGKSLIDDTEITRLAGVHNYDDTALTAKVDAKARIILSTTEPSDLKAEDLWIQEI